MRIKHCGVVAANLSSRKPTWITSAPGTPFCFSALMKHLEAGLSFSPKCAISVVMPCPLVPGPVTQPVLGCPLNSSHPHCYQHLPQSCPFSHISISRSAPSNPQPRAGTSPWIPRPLQPISLMTHSVSSSLLRIPTSPTIALDPHTSSCPTLVPQSPALFSPHHLSPHLFIE